MQQITAPLADLPADPVASVANQDFPIVLRGYDREAVDAYVRDATQLVAELYATRSPEGAVRRALERVGEQVSAILQRAHDTAEGLTTQSRAEAEERLIDARRKAEEVERSARQQAEEIVRISEHRLQELDAEVDRIWAERDRIVGDVRKLSEDLDALAGAAATRFPAETTDEPFPAEPGEEAFPAEPTEEAFPAEATEEADALPASVVEPGAGAPIRSERRGEKIRLIDLLHLGRERVIGCWQVGDVLVDPGPSSCLRTLLEALDGEGPRALLLTHIHLDHAGVAGSLVRRWPDLEVYVHERGAPHLMDPSRLLESARRLYGQDMDRLWGEVRPVPSRNIRLLRGDEELLGGRFEVAYTPGHASHHVSYLHAGTAFVGDVAGVRITPHTLTIPPTPPPDIDVEAWHASIERLLRWNPERLAITHFGSSDDVEAQLAEVSERLDTWTALARTEDLDTFVATVRDEIESDAGPELLPAYEQAAPPKQLYAGLERYWQKRSETDQPTERHPSAESTRAPLPAPASTHAGRSSQSGH